MTRKIVSTTLLVSLVALASSGIMMIVLGSYEFKSIKKYQGSRKVFLFAAAMMVFMLLLYFAGYKKPLDETIINEIEMSSSKLQKGH